MVKQVKLTEYTEIGDELDFTTAFIQASKALDLAGSIASNKQDTDTLNQVAALYIEMGARLMQPIVGHMEGDHEVEEEYEVPEKQALGFAPRPVEEIIPQEEVEENG